MKSDTVTTRRKSASRLFFLSSLFFFFASILAIEDARATVELIVTVNDARHVRDLRQVKSHGVVRDSRLVFSESERTALLALGRPHVAEAIKVTVDSEHDVMDLKSWADRTGLKVQFERNSIAFSLSLPGPDAVSKQTNSGRDLFFPRQWALENTGQTELLALDDLTSLPIAGVPGEDIGLKNAPPENLDPSRTVTVAVLDSGVDYDHPDLQDAFFEKPSECRALAAYTKCQSEDKTPAGRKACDEKFGSQDTDGNGYPMDCAGWNMTGRQMPGSQIRGDADASDQNGHGTHVSGIIAAKANAIGVRGVMNNVKILPVKVITAAPTEPVRPASVPGSISHIAKAAQEVDPAELPLPNESALPTAQGFGDLVARGVLYAVRSGAQVINMSLGWPSHEDSNLMRQMIDLAQARDILVVAAAGNDATNALILPCLYSGVICVGSHDPNGAISNFSNFGSGVDIAAPGMNILSAFPMSKLSYRFNEAVGYEVKSGTSMASPYVAGVIARLLNAGIDAKEIYGRLIAGARPHHSSTVRSRYYEPMYTLSGNVDLARSMNTRPQPVILPEDKAPIPILWNQVDREVRFSIPLKNFWASARRVQVQAKIISATDERPDGRLSTSSWSVSDWAGQATRNLTTSLIIDNDRIESDLLLELQVSADDGTLRTFRLQTDIRVPVSPASSPHLKAIPIENAGEIQGASLRTVDSLDGRPGNDYLALEQDDESWTFWLLKDRLNESYKVTARNSIPAPPKNTHFYYIHRVDLDGNGSSEYVLVFMLPATPEKRMPTLVFEIYDEHLRPFAVNWLGPSSHRIEYDNAKAVLSDRFQWMMLNGRLTPSWVSRGLTPESEKPSYAPWNPSPLDLPEYRVYYISPDGLRTVKTPKDYAVIAQLNPSSEQRKSGSMPVLYAKGRGTDMEYATGEVVDGQLVNFKPISLGSFRALRGVNMKEVTSLSPDRERSGTMFPTPSHRGAQRITSFVAKEGGNRIFDDISDAIIAPVGIADAVTQIAAFFSGDTRQAAFAQTIYDIQYVDLSTKEIAVGSLRRYSFMPGQFFYNFFFPAVIGDSTAPKNGDRLPGLYVSAGLGLSQGLEVITPRYSSNGRLKGLVRPARLRLDAKEGCEAISLAVRPTKDHPSQAMFFCGDRFIKAPLVY